MRLKVIILCVSWFAIWSLQVTAQSTPIEISTTLESTINSGGVNRYQLTLLETTIISLHAVALDGDLDPIVRLVDSSGNVVIENDDYNYPETNNALIQAFVIPRTDTYTIEIAAFGETSGTYQLSILPGYDQQAAEDIINNKLNWQTVDSNTISLTEVEGRLRGEVEGISKSGTLLASDFPQAEDFYFEASINNINATSNWQVGIVFRYVNEDLYYRLIMNDQGFWQLEFVRNGEVEVLQSWSTHPAIVPGETSFTLGVLTSGESIDIVYNRQLIAAVYASRILQEGGVGIAITTANALGSRVSVDLDQALMTIPSQFDNQLVFPEVLVANNYTSLAHTLERQQVIPVGGEVKFTAPQIEVRNVNPGVSRFSAATGVTFAEFVMGGTIQWIKLGDGIGGCGITFNDTNDEQYTLAYINSNGEYGVSQRNGDAFVAGIYGDRLTTDMVTHSFTIIVGNGQIHYYIDNQHVGKMPYTPTSGEIKTAVVNFDGVDTTCNFSNLWLWSLDTDSSS